MKEFRIRWNVFTDKTGESLIYPEILNAVLNYTNTLFEQTRFHFSTEDVVYITDQAANHANWGERDLRNNYYRQYGKDSNKLINIFIMEGDGANGGRQRLGVANFPFPITPSDPSRPLLGLAMTASFFDDIDIDFEGSGAILAHELGHCFGLFHTFNTFSAIGNSCTTACWDAPNESGESYDPYHLGDFIRDTRPHEWQGRTNPGLLREEDGCEEYLDQHNDSCSSNNFYNGGETIFSNLMNYTSCPKSFTPEQTMRMHCVLENHLPNTWVRNVTTNITEDFQDLTYSAYPNPFEEELQLVLGDKEVYAQVFNALGQVVYTALLRGDQLLSTVDWEEGAYFVRISNNKGLLQSLKVMKY